ncbi:hypothetical protein V6U90_22495 [Micromonospora sp. CPCC 206060]|uniref:hypothetical protein n=1 Tax=Micromonospora sp. CPCC 206060 TaxID=3122406 RepID=UPI002FF25D91
MTERDDPQRKERMPVLGQPPAALAPDADPDFANEHEETAVASDVITGEDEEVREPESPRGWAGMQR